MFRVSINEMFWSASLDELKQGFIEEENYICLLCGKKVEKGIIYREDGVLYEARKYMSVHICNAHGSVFEYLLNLDKALTGLTEHQQKLMTLFYQGLNDKEVQKELNIGSLSTIRNHRFVLKEKERQAKLLLVILELLKEKDKHGPSFVSIHKTARMVDERYDITEKEKSEIINKYFPKGINVQLNRFPLKEKHKLVVLGEIIKRFETEKRYIEKEVNQILIGIYDDYVILRRFLIEYGFLERKSDGSEYWVK